MTLTDLVPTLDFCQQLKAAGFPQDTAMVWVGEHEYDFEAQQFDGCHIALIRRDAIAHEHEVICAAPTAGELEEWLAVRGFSLETWYGTDSLYHIEQRGYVFRGDKPLAVKDALHVAALAALVLEVAG